MQNFPIHFEREKRYAAPRNDYTDDATMKSTWSLSPFKLFYLDTNNAWA